MNAWIDGSNNVKLRRTVDGYTSVVTPGSTISVPTFDTTGSLRITRTNGNELSTYYWDDTTGWVSIHLNTVAFSDAGVDVVLEGSHLGGGTLTSRFDNFIANSFQGYYCPGSFSSSSFSSSSKSSSSSSTLPESLLEINDAGDVLLINDAGDELLIGT